MPYSPVSLAQYQTTLSRSLLLVSFLQLPTNTSSQFGHRSRVQSGRGPVVQPNILPQVERVARFPMMDRNHWSLSSDWWLLSSDALSHNGFNKLKARGHVITNRADSVSDFSCLAVILQYIILEEVQKKDCILPIEQTPYTHFKSLSSCSKFCNV